MSGGVQIQLRKHLPGDLKKRVSKMLSSLFHLPVDTYGHDHTSLYRVWPKLKSGYLTLEYNSGNMEWASALLRELHSRGLVKRYRWETDLIWHKDLDPRDRPFAMMLDGDKIINMGPMFPVGHKKRKWYEDERNVLEGSAEVQIGATYL